MLNMSARLRGGGSLSLFLSAGLWAKRFPSLALALALSLSLSLSLPHCLCHSLAQDVAVVQFSGSILLSGYRM